MKNTGYSVRTMINLDLCLCLYNFSIVLNFDLSGKRTYVKYFDNSGPWGPWFDTLKIVQDQVLSDKRSAAFAATIIDIKEGPFGAQLWYNCKGCEDWYKSEDTILSEARYYSSLYFIKSISYF